MDIFHYYIENDSRVDLESIGGHYLTKNELEMITWERTHFSPFAYYYGLHAELEGAALRGNGSLEVNSTHLLKHKSRDLVKFSIECVAISVVGVPGIVGNVLSAIVLLTAKMRSPITYLLLGLALTDLLMILNCLLGMAVPSYFLYYKIDLFRYRFAAFLPVIFSIGKTAHVASVLYALFITMERYFAVMYPLKARLFCTLTRAKISSIVILVFSIVYNIPRFFEYTYIKIPTSPKYGEDDDTSGDPDFYYFPLTADLRKNELYRKLFVGMHYSLFYFIPMVLIIYFNALIYRKLKMAQKQRELMTVSQISENNVTTMLFIIVIVFMMCNILPVVNLIARLANYNPQIFVLNSVRNFLWIFNSSVNFVIYYAYSDGFRETFIDLWQSCFRCCYTSARKKRRLKYTSSGYTYNTSTSSSRMSVVTIQSNFSSVKRHFGDTLQGQLGPKSDLTSSQTRSNSIVHF